MTNPTVSEIADNLRTFAGDMRRDDSDARECVRAPYADAIEGVADLLSKAKDECVWTQVCEDYFDTACKKYFEFSDGGVADNGFEFCPFCGGVISILNEGDS